MVVKDSPEDTVLEDRCRCDLPECHGGGMADQEEDASSRSIRQLISLLLSSTSSNGCEASSTSDSDMLSNPNEDPTTKDIHEDKNDVGDEKEVLDGHIPIEVSKRFLQVDDSNSMTATVAGKSKREQQGLVVQSTFKCSLHFGAHRQS